MSGKITSSADARCNVDRRMSSGIVGIVQARAAAAAGALTDALAGYAAVFNTETVIAGMFREKILPGAFAASIKADDLPALFNHDANYVLGRTANGTVRLKEDRKGLHYEVDINADDPMAVSVGAKVARGDVRGSSFAFSVEDDADEEWVRDDPAKLPLRIVKRARLYDVAPVTSPAYPTTSVSATATERALALRPELAGVALDVLERELELDELEASLPPVCAAREYSPGLLGVYEREIDLLELECGL